ncbi:hypothetical protein SPHFLASMR4Y_00228 [Sphingorhabdus sp. SMR4y]|nr:hypothetical protein SPHFLASMR4Y_00228 [Sphingorhabdus sp. SMR4y]
MSRDLNYRNMEVHKLIEKLQGILNFLDENDLPIPAIKIDAAINALEETETEELPQSSPD